MSGRRFARRNSAVLLGLAIHLAASLSGCAGGGGKITDPPPPPAQITLTLDVPSISVDSGNNFVTAGAPSFTLLVAGTGFTASSQILWNGSDLTTTYGDANDLSAAVPASLVADPGTASITVYDSSLKVTSNALPFGIASPAAATAGVVQLITIGTDGSPANDNTGVQPSISWTGRFVVFESKATNLAPGPSSGHGEIYERDTCVGAPTGCTPSTIRITVTEDGSPINANGYDSAVSADGRYVAFDSSATNIVENTGVCGPGICVFLRDTCIGAAASCVPSTVLASVNADGSAAVGELGLPSTITPDGRYVAFDSNAPDVGGDGAPGGLLYMSYLRDTCNGAPPGCAPATLLVSASSDGALRNIASIHEAVGAIGRYVAFSSYATNLGGEVNLNNNPGVFLRDTCAGAPTGCSPATSKMDQSTAGAPANDAVSVGFGPVVGADGRIVAFTSQATNLASVPLTITGTVYVRDTCIGAAASCSPTTTLVSVANDGSLPNASQNNETMSADGRFVAFASLASNLVPGDSFTPNGWKDIFLRDTCFGAPTGCVQSTVRASVTSSPSFNTEANQPSDDPVISGDGHYVVFLSSATNLAPGIAGNGHGMIFLAKTGF